MDSSSVANVSWTNCWFFMVLSWIPFCVQKSWCPYHGLADLSPGWIPLMDTRDGFRWVQQIVSRSNVLGCAPNSPPSKKSRTVCFDNVWLCWTQNSMQTSNFQKNVSQMQQWFSNYILPGGCCGTSFWFGSKNPCCSKSWRVCFDLETDLCIIMIFWMYVSYSHRLWWMLHACKRT